MDTSGWASLFIETETHHREAFRHFDQAKRISNALITTNYVISELVTLLPVRQRASRKYLFQCVDSIRFAPFVSLIHIGQSIDEEAWALCKSREDKNWSLVDASSFVVMQQLNIQKALTTDRHFEQAGFIRLLKDSL